MQKRNNVTPEDAEHALWQGEQDFAELVDVVEQFVKRFGYLIALIAYIVVMIILSVNGAAK